MTTTPVVAVVEDRPDLFAWIIDRHRHHPEVIGVQVGIADRQAMSIVAEAVLGALGKDPWLSISKRPAELLAGAWLTTGDVTDVIIGYPQLISDWLLPEVISWFVGLGIRPWLVFTTSANDEAIRERAAKVAADWGCDVVDFAAVVDAWPDTTTTCDEAPPPDGNPSGLPTLPRVDGMRFRSTCRKLLTSEQFAAVDAAFTAAVAELRSEIEEIAETLAPRAYAKVLREHLCTARDTEEFVLWARAAQVAGVPWRFHVSVNTTVLIGAAESLPRVGLAGPQRWWEHLDTYRDPDPGAASALFSAGVDPEAIPTMAVGDVGDRNVTVDGVQHPVEEGWRFIETLVAFRRLAGAPDDAMLFATHRKEAVRSQFVASLIWSHRSDTGVQVAPTPTIRRQPAALTWLGRYGITVRKAGKTKMKALA